MSCICQECGLKYKVDVIVPDDVWERIKPKNKPKGAGLLCGPCITTKLESFDEYAAYRISSLWSY